MGISFLPPWATDDYVEQRGHEHDRAYNLGGSTADRLFADAALGGRVTLYGVALVCRGVWFAVLGVAMFIACAAFGWRRWNKAAITPSTEQIADAMEEANK